MSIANYKWASSLISFARFAPAHKETLNSLLSARSVAAAPWHTGLEFRITISFLHELVHFYQDLYTGAGHADYLIYRRLNRKAFACAEQILALIEFFGISGENESDLSSLYEQLQAALLLDADPDIRQFVVERKNYADKAARIQEIQDFLQQLFGAELIPLEPESLLTESLFENEAVATVYLQYLQFKCSDDQYLISKAFDYLVRPETMTGVYTGCIDILTAFSREALGAEADPDLIERNALTILNFILDLSAAYPPRTLLEASGIDRVAFEPGVKFTCLLHALQTMDQVQADLFIYGLTGQNATMGEQALLKSCRINYPPADMVYAAWLDLFEDLRTDRLDHLLETRINACKARLSSRTGSFAPKDLALYTFTNQNLPLSVISNDGIIIYGQHIQTLDEFRFGYMTALLSWNLDFNLFHLLHEGQEFNCPYAESQVCSISRPNCRHIHKLTDIPAERQCYVFNDLKL